MSKPPTRAAISTTDCPGEALPVDLGLPGLTLDRARAFDAAVLASAGISRIGSSSSWIAAAHQQLHTSDGPSEPIIDTDGVNWVALTEGPFLGVGHVVRSIEAGWGFACPGVGPDAVGVARLLREVVGRRERRPDLLFLAGIPEDSRLFWALLRALGRRFRMRAIPGNHCCIASLEGGYSGYLERRSGRFRSRSRRLREEADEAGYTVEIEAPGAGDRFACAFDRIVRIERASWKWTRNESVFQESSHAEFYRTAMRFFAAHGRLRVATVRDAAGTPRAYASGAVLGEHYRGFQMSFDADHARWGLGNVAQLHLIESLAREGVRVIDFGMEIGYKARWSDRQLRLVNLIAH